MIIVPMPHTALIACNAEYAFESAEFLRTQRYFCRGTPFHLDGDCVITLETCHLDEIGNDVEEQEGKHPGSDQTATI